MKNLRFARKYWLASIAVLLFAGNALASGISGTLVVESKSKGRHYSIMVKPDGSFETPELPPDTYTFRCTINGAAESDVQISYSSQPVIVDNKRPGKVKYKNIVLKRGLMSSESTHTKGHSVTYTATIAIDEPGMRATGVISVKNPNGKTMAIDDWTTTK